MRRIALSLLTLTAIFGLSPLARAQNDATDDETPFEDLDDGGSLETLPDDPLLGEGLAPDPVLDGAPAIEPSTAKAEQKNTLATDVVVVQRRQFLKAGRLELQPHVGVTINDPLIRHWGFGGTLDYFLSDVFGIGLHGMYFLKERTDREGLIGLQFNRLPTLNEYHWTAALNFTYVPLYGKFSLFNRHIVHWEGTASAGIGATQTEIIPRNIANDSFSTIAVTPNVGIGFRFFLFDWMTVNFSLRDYIFIDRFESPDRPVGQTAAEAESNAESQLVNNLMFYAGVGFYLPPTFSYTTAR